MGAFFCAYLIHLLTKWSSQTSHGIVSHACIESSHIFASTLNHATTTAIQIMNRKIFHLLRFFGKRGSVVSLFLGMGVWFTGIFQ